MTTLVILLHGVGGTGAGMLSLAGPLGFPGAVFAAPEGTEPFDGGSGRQWFSVSGITEANRPGRVAVARAGLDAAIAKAVAKAGQPERVVLVGFSQGSIMALDALARGAAVEVIAFAGRLAGGEVISPRPGARVLLVGGGADAVMPAAQSTLAAERFQAAGVAAEALILPGVPHTITQEGIAAARRFLAAG